MYSTINVQRNQKLSDCYNQLVETIYRIEFPTNQQPPNVRSLSATCGWNVSNETADNIAKLVLTAPTTETNTSNNNLISSAVTNNSNPTNQTQGFNTQDFVALQNDDLAKLQLTRRERRVSSNPTSSNNNSTQTRSSNVRVVKAQTGDTVAILAQRYGALAVDVAKFNGLLPTTKLVAGREIRIPSSSSNNRTNQTSQNNNLSEAQKNLGVNPTQAQDGKVKAVIDYFNETLNDPYSMRFVRWSKAIEKSYRGTKYWSVQVKFRAKNSYGAYVLSEWIFYIKTNKVVAVEKIY